MISGLPGVFIAFILIMSVADPQPKPTENPEEEKAAKESSYNAYEAVSSYSIHPDGVGNGHSDDMESLISNNREQVEGTSGESQSDWKQCFRFVTLYLILAACLRRSGTIIHKIKWSKIFE